MAKHFSEEQADFINRLYGSMTAFERQYFVELHQAKQLGNRPPSIQSLVNRWTADQRMKSRHKSKRDAA